MQRHGGIGPMKLGASGTRPHSQQPSSCWAAKACAVPGLQGSLSAILLHHSSASISRCQLGSRGNSQTPPISPPWPRCCSMLVRRACWRLLDCLKNSTNLAKKKYCHDCSVAKLSPAPCEPVACSTPGFPILHYLLGFAQTHVH